MFGNTSPKSLSGSSSIKTLKNLFKGPIVGLITLVVFFSVITPGFFSYGNFVNVLNQIAIWGVLALGITFVIITGGNRSFCRLCAGVGFYGSGLFL